MPQRINTKIQRELFPTRASLSADVHAHPLLFLPFHVKSESIAIKGRNDPIDGKWC